MTKSFNDQLSNFNNKDEHGLHIVPCLRIVRQTSRLVRILRRPGGHALLVGNSGSGRRALTKFSAALMQATYRCPTIGNGMEDTSKDELIMEFHFREIKNHISEDTTENFEGTLRASILSCCLFDSPSVIYLGEEVLNQQKCLHLLQVLVSVGVPHGILTSYDVSLLMQHWQLKSNRPTAPADRLWPLINETVRENVHIVLAISSMDLKTGRCHNN